MNNNMLGDIQQHIREHSFPGVYLLTGDQAYLIRQARLALEHALVAEGDTMNCTRYVSERVDINEFREMAFTYPFFAEKRVLILDETGILKTEKDTLVELFAGLPETTCIIIIEAEADKRTSVYRWIKKNGYVAEALQKDQNERQMMDAAVAWFKKAGKKIRRGDAALLAAFVGDDLYVLRNEVDKLIAYSGEESVISREAIDTLVGSRIENRIFELTDAIASGDKSKVLDRYNELLMLKEAPMRILYMITRQYRILLIACEMNARGTDSRTIAKEAGVQPYFIGKVLKQLTGYSKDAVLDYLDACLETEERIKTGKEGDRLGLETLLISLTEKTPVI